ncbi:unnamed protein product [Paramecium pentaurelia]|uniref:Uncharacterized protein n=1 Tax=Paramecium pentaurelia TaxID=43138 RepID=A0A8S1VV28_9CILI|nr:unnamed protein product [Paramecium pentaurelia]
MPHDNLVFRLITYVPNNLVKNFQQLSLCINNWLWIEYNYKCLSKFHFKQFNQWSRIKYLTMSRLFYLIWRLRWSKLYFIPNYYLWINVTIYLQQYLRIGQYFYILLIHVMKQQHQICSYLSDYCYYANNLCQQLTCANFTTLASCKFVMSLFKIGEMQLCQWSKNTYIPLILIQLHLQNLIQLIVQQIQDSLKDGFQQQIKIVQHEQIFLVFIKKLNNFNSIQIYQKNLQTILNIQLISQKQIPGQCACNQLTFQYDCLTNPQCCWSTAITTPSCYNKPCNQIIQQGICSSNPRCSFSATQNTCQTFLSCSDLYGVNSRVCANYSIYCAAISKIFLLLQQNYICPPKPNQCSVTISQGTVGGTTIVSECENTYVNLSITNMMIFFYYDYQLIKTKSQINTESIITNNITQITNNKLNHNVFRYCNLKTISKILIILIFVTTNENNNKSFLCSCKLQQSLLINNNVPILNSFISIQCQLMLMHKSQKSLFKKLLLQQFNDVKMKFHLIWFWFLCNMQLIQFKSDLQISMFMQQIILNKNVHWLLLSVHTIQIFLLVLSKTIHQLYLSIHAANPNCFYIGSCQNYVKNILVQLMDEQISPLTHLFLIAQQFQSIVQNLLMIFNIYYNQECCWLLCLV